MIAVAILVVGLSFAAGYNAGDSGEIEEVAERPEKWQPKSHEDLLRACGLVCGPTNVKKYSSIYGECICMEKKQ